MIKMQEKAGPDLTCQSNLVRNLGFGLALFEFQIVFELTFLTHLINGLVS